VDLARDGTLNGRPVTTADFTDKNGVPTFVKTPSMHPAIAVTTESAPAAYARIVAEVGCSLHRDAVDLRLISELTSLGTKGHTLDHKDAKGEALAGGQGEIKSGPTPVDTDGDGIPDAWETVHGLDPKNPADAAKFDASGYSNLEVYLNSLVVAAAH